MSTVEKEDVKIEFFNKKEDVKQYYRCTHMDDGPFWNKGEFIYIYIECCDIIRNTPCGLKVDSCGIEKLIIHSHIKKFANETVEEAIISYCARQRSWHRNLLVNLHSVTTNLDVIKRYEEAKSHAAPK
jgi:hypothetical protein